MKATAPFLFMVLWALACSSPTDDGGGDPRFQVFWVDSIGGVDMDLGKPFEGLLRSKSTYPFGYPLFENDSLGFAVADFRIGCNNKKGEAFSEIAWVHYRRTGPSIISAGEAAFPPSEGMACTLVGTDQVLFQFPVTTEVITAHFSLEEDGCAYLRMRLPGGGTVESGVHYAGEPIPGFVTFWQPMPQAVLKSEDCF